MFNAAVEIEGEPDTNPANNTTARTVTVAAAPARPKPCIVPNVVRKPLAIARSAILKAGCRLGVTRTVSSATVPKGRVVRQTPGARKRVARGTRVTLVVSRGKQS
jgi:beta-lactam-binding protein with PASTA domain